MNKRYLLLLCAMTIAVSHVSGQSEKVIKDEVDNLKKAKVEFNAEDTVYGWKYSGFTSLTFAQTSLSNWAAGGQGSIAILGTVNVNANLKRKKYSWDNLLNLNYGVLKADGDEYRKNDDRIELLSKFGYRIAEDKDFYYTGLASFKTQFNVTRDLNGVRISDFMAPAYLQLAVGISYSKNENFSVFFAPISGKFTFVRNQQLADSGAYGVERAIIDPVTFAVLTPGKKFRSEFGAYFLMMAKLDIMENITLSTRLDLFNNYTDANKPNRKNIDVNWENMISMKINKYVTTSLFTHLIYDNDIPILLNDPENPSRTGPRVQFKQIFGAGLSYKF